MEENVINEIVEDTIKQIDEMPFGITDDEINNQEVIEEVIENKGSENDESTNK